ncbi:MAG: hypothetical protein AAF525_21370 [Pseudomonadota bacterium]
MTDDDNQTSNTNALNDAKRLQAAAYQRGGYPRGFALATAVWAGLLTTGITAGHDWWFIVLTTGIAGFFYARHQQGAWVNEVSSPTDLVYIFSGVAFIVFVGCAGFVGRHYFELGFAPYLSGLIVGIAQYWMMQWSRAETGAPAA